MDELVDSFIRVGQGAKACCQGLRGGGKRGHGELDAARVEATGNDAPLFLRAVGV